ncbi:MAG: GspE/PulE family protein [Proteobacteria bacterium]|nr:GspE/PulE family protein [Pseudomonadota bacterium]
MYTGTEQFKKEIFYGERKNCPQMSEIADRIFGATNLNEILIDLKDDLTKLFKAERMTIYTVDGINKELVSQFMSAGEVDEIRVPVSNQSIVGFAVMQKKLISIADVYDEMELNAIDEGLHFDSSWDKKMAFRTRQVLATPIIFKRFLLGAVQLINHTKGIPFSEDDKEKVERLVDILGNAFHIHKTMTAKGKTNRFGYLLENHFLTQKDLKRASSIARDKNEPVEDILINEFNISKNDIGKALSKYYGVDFVEFDKNIVKPIELMQKIRPDYIRRNIWVPLRKEGENGVVIAIDNPQNLFKIDQINLLYKGRHIVFKVALREDIYKFIDMFTNPEADQRYLTAEGIAIPNEELETLVTEESSEVVKLVNRLILEGYERGASDIHIEPYSGHRESRVRFRVDGSCTTFMSIPVEYRESVIARIKIMSDLDIAERRKPQDGKIKFKKFGPEDIELRVATLPTQGGLEDVVLRILSAGKPIPLDKIGFSQKNYINFLNVISQPYGIIFVCGPTGSGKTTTLHSALGYINKDDTKIWTAEDPVEITQDGLRQVQVNPKIGFTFANAMRAFLRADPDVIMVGEMRDPETTAIGIEASLTGHLVLSTIHTNSASESITRLLDMGMDPFNFADAVLGILAQRLVRTLCPKCKSSYHPTKQEYDELVREYGISVFEKNFSVSYTDDLTLYRPIGCEKCNRTGYSGRMGLHELLVGTDAIKSLIQSRAPVEKIRAQAIADGMTTLKQDGIEKVFSGFCDLLQVRKVCIK